MNLFSRLVPRAWIAALLLALGFVAWTQHQRMKRVEYVTALGAIPLAPAADSPTGYAGGLRRLLAPGQNNESYQWIAQTQQMLARHEWRIRHVDYDNAPVGRAVTSPSPYRWWLGLVAWCDQRLSGRSPGMAVEHAALWADPVLLALFLVAGTVLAALRFGPWAALVFPLAGATLFPLGGAFLPGAPDDIGLGLVLVGTSLLALLAGLRPRDPAGTPETAWFVTSGVVGALALWVNVGQGVPILLGVGLGALLAAWLDRRQTTPAPPWRAWGISGASATLAAWLIEYAPAHLDLATWRLSEIHPLYALAWLGGGELLARNAARSRAGSPSRNRRDLVVISCALLALAVVPLVMLAKGVPGFLAKDNFAFRLTALGDETEAGNFAKWIVRERPGWRLLATVLPLGVLGFACLRGLRDPDRGQRNRLVLAAAPSLVAFAFACSQLGWWNTVDVTLLVLLAAVCADAGVGTPVRGRSLAWLAALVPGAIALWPPPAAPGDDALTRRELQGLVEREFAHWLARRVGPDGAIVLAPPNLTTSLYFHGGLRGLGSPYRENADGFRAAVRLAGASSADEAQALARQRKLTHIAIPSWDGFLDEYARLGSDQPEHTLMGLLHSWLPPRWLRPVPYYLPNLKGFEGERLILFETADVQDNAGSLSRLTEYFLDMGQTELAAIATRTLASDYGTDLGAQVAKARTEIARHDRTGLDQTLATILAALRDGSGDSLAWDRRVSLCLVLAAGNQMSPAREQAQRCLEEMGELDLRSLSESTLFRFLGLCKALGLRIEDPALESQAKALLPPPLRSQL
ncbi:MAG TPA: hypothetical protein VG734_17280 [Lacunisphaera sp.]|nr:hypothetical protein [Lacunisphaera sp.]